MMQLLVLSSFLCIWYLGICVVDGALDCSVYSSELDAVNYNPFFVSLYLLQQQTSVQYDDKLQQMKQMIIANDKNPSTSVFCLKNLQLLTLINTNISSLSEIANLKNLTSLRIESDNGVIGDYLPAEVGQLISLSSLKLINIQNMKYLPDEIGQLTLLQELTLSQIPNLVHIPAIHMGRLTELRVLNLIDLPQLPNFPYPMENFQQLTTLVLTNTSVPSLQLQNIQRLRSLKVSSNLAMTSIEIKNLPTLYSLDIRDNVALKTVTVQNLFVSGSLSFSANQQLTSIVMENITALSGFSIYTAQSLETITLVNTPALGTVTLSSNPTLQSVSIENAQGLTIVSLTGNPLLKTLLFTYTSRVEQLDLSSCQLTSIPSSILTLTSLQTLNMQSNQLSSLPDTLSTDLPNLKVLNLINNLFRGNIIQPPLIYIRELYMSNNSLTTLDGLGGYRSLQKINIDFNQITAIPLEILKISPVLQLLSIVSNPLTSIPYPMTNMRSLKFLLAMQNNLSQNERAYLIRLFQPTSITVNLF